MSWARTHIGDLGISPDFERLDLHLHVPAGAVSKDGPSAGLAMIALGRGEARAQRAPEA